MLGSFPSPILSVAPDVLKDMEGGDALSGVWTLFTKCKESLQDGRRLENALWRLWYAELASASASTPLSEKSLSSLQTSSHLTVSTDFAAEQSHRSPLLMPIAPPSPSSLMGDNSRCPSPNLTSSSSDDMSLSHSHLSVSDIHIPAHTTRRSSSVGKIICDLLRDKLVVPQRSPASEASSYPVLHSTSYPPNFSNPNNASQSQSQRVPTVVTTSTASGMVTTPPSTSTTAPSTPQPGSLFPRVVIVNPTPHPTPPATPQMPATAIPPSFAVPVNANTLLPPAHSVAPTFPSPAPSSSSSSHSHTNASTSTNAMGLAPRQKMNTNEETLKASDRRRFFLKSESPDKDSPERETPPDKDKCRILMDLSDSAGVVDYLEGASAVSASSAASLSSTKESVVSAVSERESAVSKRTGTTGSNAGGGGGTKGKKGKEVVRHAPARPTMHRAHTARANHVPTRKSVASASSKADLTKLAVVAPMTKVAQKTTLKSESLKLDPNATISKLISPTMGKVLQTTKAIESPRSSSKPIAPAPSNTIPSTDTLKIVPSRKTAVAESTTKTRPTFKIGSSSSHGTNPSDTLEAPQRAPPPPSSVATSQSKPTAPPSQSRSHPRAEAKSHPHPSVVPSVSKAPAPPASQRRGIVISTSSEYETTDTEDDSWESEDPSERSEPIPPPAPQTGPRTASHLVQPTKEEIRIREAALEAQRQRELFTKLPERSYSNLQRTQSGLLSQLLNPDPTIFPAEHPYRRSRFSEEDVSARARQLGLTMTGTGSSMAAPRLQTSKSSAAVPQAAQVTALAPSSGTRDRTVKAQVNGIAKDKDKDKGKQKEDVNGGGGYKPRGMPSGQDMEYSDSEDEGEEDNGIQVSKSLAQQKLAALAGPHRKAVLPLAQQKQDEARNNRQLPQRPPPPHALAPQASRTRTEPTPQQSERPMLTSVASAPIPLGHPYNLPAPAPPMTPRTTRRQMLATELSESLRRNLLWERQVSKVNMTGGARRHGLLGNNLRPLTTVAASGSGSGEGTLVNGQIQGAGQTQATLVAGQEAIRREASGGDEGEKDERRRKAMARNRSWADDYHYSGW